MVRGRDLSLKMSQRGWANHSTSAGSGPGVSVKAMAAVRYAKPALQEGVPTTQRTVLGPLALHTLSRAC